MLGEGEHIRIHGDVAMLLLLLRGQVGVNTEVAVMLLPCHLARHGEVFELLLLLLCVASDFLVLILPGVLDTSEVILDLLDVIDNPGLIMGC
jgi:hypothetical protein